LSIYLDNMAATPIDVRVADHHRAAMMAHSANAHSTEHSVGVAVREAIEQASADIVGALGEESRPLCFTPGASAALWLAIEDVIARTAGTMPRIAASATEHPALLGALAQAERDGRISLSLLPVDGNGLPRLDAIDAALGRGIDLLCTMAANNEVGTLTDMAAIRALLRGKGVSHLVDASQAAGKVDLADAMEADLIIISGAKVYGPRRTGALIGALHSTAERRAHDLFGSPDAPGAMALAFAMQLRARERDEDEARLQLQRDWLQARLVDGVPGLVVNGIGAERLAGCLHISSPHIPGDAVVSRLWGELAVSTGAACQSGAQTPSHVLTAMGLPEWARDGAVRIGLGRFTTDDEIERAAALLVPALNALAPARRVA